MRRKVDLHKAFPNGIPPMRPQAVPVGSPSHDFERRQTQVNELIVNEKALFALPMVKCRMNSRWRLKPSIQHDVGHDIDISRSPLLDQLDVLQKTAVQPLATLDNSEAMQ